MESKLIETWFANLNWDAARIEEERKEVLETNNVCCTTEISAPWSAVEHIYETCVKRVTEEIPDITIFGAHASHCYSNGINLYFVYWYNVVDCSLRRRSPSITCPSRRSSARRPSRRAVLCATTTAWASTECTGSIRSTALLCTSSSA